MPDLSELAAELTRIAAERRGELTARLRSLFRWPEGAELGEPAPLGAVGRPAWLGQPGLVMGARMADGAVALFVPDPLLGDAAAAGSGPTSEAAADLAGLLATGPLGPGAVVRRADLAAALDQAAPVGPGAVCLEMKGAGPPAGIAAAVCANWEPLVGGEAASQADGSEGDSGESRPGGERPGSGAPAPFTRSLLKVKTPVAVTLASLRLPVRRILELGPGSLLQFDKACDEELTLEVGGQAIAVGEAVKVGEKFGLRITAMAPPRARFRAVEAQQRGANRW